MKIHLETDDNLREPEIVLRVPELNDDSAALQAAIARAIGSISKIKLEIDDKDFYVAPSAVLFFESVEGKTYAHTATKLYRTRAKLYELETILPGQFLRVSKSAILNSSQVLSIRRNLAGPSLIEFRASLKKLTVSRGYLKKLENKLNERSLL
jgi:DNA-binding LytR/AlgR family response regulator